jgi:hypothetical protein
MVRDRAIISHKNFQISLAGPGEAFRGFGVAQVVEIFPRADAMFHLRATVRLQGGLGQARAGGALPPLQGARPRPPQIRRTRRRTLLCGDI